MSSKVCIDAKCTCVDEALIFLQPCNHTGVFPGNGALHCYLYSHMVTYMWGKIDSPCNLADHSVCTL